METIATVVLPVFGIVFLGYGARRTGYLGDKVDDGLTVYIFNVAIPFLIFRTLVEAETPAVSPWAYWAAYFGGVAVVWGLAMLFVRRIEGGTPLQAVAAGIAAGFSNTVMLGIPLIYTAFGEAGAVPLFLLISVHLPVLFLVGTILAETSLSEERTNVRAVVTATFSSLARNPIVIAILAGGLYRLSGLPIPEILRSLVATMAASAVPCALFAMGMSLNRYGLLGEARATAVLVTLKLVVHPAVVFVLAYYVFSLPAVWAATAVVFAATPTGVNAYAFATRYGKGAPLASSTIALSTALAVITVSIWLGIVRT